MSGLYQENELFQILEESILKIDVFRMFVLYLYHTKEISLIIKQQYVSKG